jgi:hypothetical protein
MMVKFYRKESEGYPPIKHFLFIPEDSMLICTECKNPIKDKESFMLCGRMSGQAWHNACFPAQHFKNWVEVNKLKHHYDYVCVLRTVSKDDFETVAKGQELEFEALMSK